MRLSTGCLIPFAAPSLVYLVSVHFLFFIIDVYIVRSISLSTLRQESKLNVGIAAESMFWYFVAGEC